MIISFKHKYIFIRCRKTASTSLETALSESCGINDIITPFCERDDTIRFDLTGVKPMNYSENAFFNHISASEIKTKVASSIWRNYYKFCVDRDPVEKVVSLYYHRKKQSTLSFENFMKSDEYLDALNYPLYTDSIGQVMVDKVVNYSHLDDELSEVAKKIGTNINIRKYKLKSQFRESLKFNITKDDYESIVKNYSREIKLQANLFKK